MLCTSIYSAFVGAMSSRENLVPCCKDRVVLLPESINWSDCMQETSKHQKRGLSGNFEHSWDSFTKNKETHTLFWTDTKDVGMRLAYRTDPIAEKLYAFRFSPSLIQEQPGKMAPITEYTSDSPCASQTRLLFVEIQ